MSKGRYWTPVFLNRHQLFKFDVPTDSIHDYPGSWNSWHFKLTKLRSRKSSIWNTNGYSETLTWLLKVHQLKSHYTTRILGLFISCSIGCRSSKDFSVICDESNRKRNYPSWKTLKKLCLGWAAHHTFSRKLRFRIFTFFSTNHKISQVLYFIWFFVSIIWLVRQKNRSDFDFCKITWWTLNSSLIISWLLLN